MGMLSTAVAFRTKAATISSAAVAISAAGWSWVTGDLAAADQCVITAHTQPVVVTWDGTTPTATLGMYVGAGATVVISGNQNVQRVNLIRQGAADATVSITLEKL
jgi:hypothetical protein